MEKELSNQVNQQNEENTTWKNSVNEDLERAKLQAQNIPQEV